MRRPLGVGGQWLGPPPRTGRRAAAMGSLIQVTVAPSAEPEKRQRDPMAYLWGAVVGAILCSLLRR